MLHVRMIEGIVLAFAAVMICCGETNTLPAEEGIDAPAALAPGGGTMRPARYDFTISPFALHAAQGAFAEAKDIGATWCRIMVRWGDAEPAPGRYEIDRMDGIVRQMQQNGLQVVPSLVAISEWGVRAGPPPGKKKKKMLQQASVKKFSGPPKDMSAWLKFVQLLVERYDGDGQDDMPGLKAPLNHWQIENEWFWQWRGTVDEYVDLLVRSSAVIKSANPNAKVISAGSTKVSAFGIADGLVNWNFIDLGETDNNRQRVSRSQFVQSERYHTARAKVETLLRDGKDAFDIVDIHCYSESPWELAVESSWIKKEMQRNGYDKPVWTLEAAGPFFDFTEERFAEDVVKRYLIGMTHGVECVFWSSLTPTLGWSENYIRLALIDTEKRKTPAYYTYKLMTSKLKELQSVEPITTQGGIYGVRAHLKNGSQVLVGWSEQGEREIAFNFDAPAANVTHIITQRNQTEPRVERIATSGGKLRLRVSTPVFVERAD